MFRRGRQPDERSIRCGMRISAFMVAAVFPARDSCSAMEKPRLGMKGNGCAGSMASGVSNGNTWVRKRSSSHTRSGFLRSEASINVTPHVGQRRAQFQPALLLIACELGYGFADAHELL